MRVFYLFSTKIFWYTLVAIDLKFYKKFMAKGAYVDPQKCIGCTLCTQICPAVFEMQDDGKSKAINPTGDTEEKIKQSIESCPVDAISLKDYD